MTVLGSTGSVGRQVLAAVDRHPDRFKVVGLSAFTSTKRLLREQIDKISPANTTIIPRAEWRSRAVCSISSTTPSSRPSASGSLEELADYPADITVSAVSGIAGLWAAVAVLKRGGTLAIANKETIVCAGRHLKALEKKHGGRILPPRHRAFRHRGVPCKGSRSRRALKSVSPHGERGSSARPASSKGSRG